MTLSQFVREPLQGKTSLSRVFWLYGVVGSLVYGALEFFLDPANSAIMRVYEVGGIVITVYVTVATYRCADNCGSPALARLVKVSAIISLLLIPVFAYLDLSGALTDALATLQGVQMPE